MVRSTSRLRLLMVATAITGIVGGCFLAFRNTLPDAPLKEKVVSLTGHPVFRSDTSAGPTAILVAVVDSDSMKRTFVWPQQALPAGGMPEEKDCRFTFFESPGGSGWPLELVRIDGDSGTLFDGSVCLVHHETMHRTLIRTLQPSERISPTPIIEESLFPHSGRVISRPGTGCEEIPTWVCDSCHRELDRWLDKARQTASVSN